MVGITQGVVAAPTLFLSREKHLSKVFLGLAILSFCLMFLKVLFNFTGLANEASFRYLPNAFELTTGPLFYLYLRALTEKGFHWTPKLFIHFLPFLFAYGYALLVFSVAYSYPTVPLQDNAAYQLFYLQLKELEDWAIVLSILGYLLLGYRRFSIFKRDVKNSNADSAYPTLSWLRTILILCIILWVYLVFNMSLSRFTDIRFDNMMQWKVYYIYVAAVTYYLGFMSYRQQVPDLAQIYQQEAPSVIKNMPCAETEQLATTFRHAVENDKLYLEPKLNLRQVAQRLNVSQPALSQAINTYFDKSFRELINEYRIEDIKTKLVESENKASILSLALESGFNSEASFYRIFKKSTGLSPTQYIDSLT